METGTQSKSGKPGRPRGRNPETYDPLLGVRVPAVVKAGVELWAKREGKKVSEFAREVFAPFEWYTTEQGQEARYILEQAVGLSVTIHNKGLDEFGPRAQRETDIWNGLPVLVFGTGDNTRYVHIVKQREGMTRQQAVDEYARLLWATLSTLPPEQRTTELVNLRTDNKHVYVISYVNLASWRVFPGELEYKVYLLRCPKPQALDKQPTTADEQRVYDYYREWFDELVLSTLPKPTDNSDSPGRWVLYDGSPDAPPTEGWQDRHELTWYPDETADEGVLRWARYMVALYVEWVAQRTDTPALFETTTPDEFIRERRADLYAVTSLRFMETGKQYMKTGT